jgi:hypothetical protein
VFGNGGTDDMIVVGGTYGERCRYPAWDQIYGSGLRAAIAVSQVSPGTILHTFAPSTWYADIEATLEGMGLRGQLHRVEHAMTFGYLHPFELIDQPALPVGQKPMIEASGDVILQFGMIEGDAKVNGRRVVYDPQSSVLGLFDAYGSRADELALIVTKSELLALTGNKQDSGSNSHPGSLAQIDQTISDAVIDLMDMGHSRPTIVLVKDGLGGLLVYQGDNPAHIDSYSAESYFRIGSGDVLAAAFAHAWGEKAMNVKDAADYAARCLSYFVEGPRLPIPIESALFDRRPNKRRPGHIRILALGDLDLQSLVLHTLGWIEHLGGSASHEILGSRDAIHDEVTNLILIGTHTAHEELEQLADVATSSPSIIYWPGARHLADYYFPRSQVTGDYATALYRTLRRADP